jgi:endonuclease/exonuclease/phosphatase family metal-dependent hydrolase
MILLSLNIRGVGGTLKKASLRRLLDKTLPDIIFLQETLVDEQRARVFLSTLRPLWFVCVVNSVGKSGGLLAAWDPTKFDLEPFLSCGGILLTGTCCENKRQLTLLNVYGPCMDIITFWDKVSALGLLAGMNLIVVGDFNFTLNADEVWGGTTLQDQAAAHLRAIFLRNKLVDILPTVTVPTWRNGRAGLESISKRLDRVFISEDLLQHSGRYRSWVAYPFLSDHAPVFLQLDTSIHRSTYPFKFNPAWLQDPYFSRLVTEVWTNQTFYKNWTYRDG